MNISSKDSGVNRAHFRIFQLEVSMGREERPALASANDRFCRKLPAPVNGYRRSYFLLLSTSRAIGIVLIAPTLKSAQPMALL